MSQKIRYIGSPDSNKNNSVLNPLLSENNFAGNSELFSISSFSILSNVNQRKIVDFSNDLSLFSAPVTLNILGVNNIDQNIAISTNIDILTLNFDKSNLNSYTHFGSLADRLRVAVEGIINKWVGSIYIVNQDSSGNYYNNITNYSYDSLKNEATFNIPSFLVINNFNLSINNNSTHITSDISIKNLNYSYNKYELLDLVTQNTFKINNFIGGYNNTSYLTVSVIGNPYPSILTGTTSDYSTLFHIKPNSENYKLFYNSLDSLQKYLLNTDSTPKYTIEVSVPTISSDDLSYNIIKKYSWSFSDGYNIDINNSLFSSYLNDLLNLGEAYDNFKSDIIYRMFMPPNIVSTDLTSIQKSKQFSRIFGRDMDEVRAFINGLTYINNTSYDKVNNIPDKLIKNLAQTLGWSTFNILETEDLFASIFNPATSSESPTQSTVADLDIELWRRIILNTSYLFKSKGTRKGIEAIFSFIGVPDCILSLDEYVYTVSGKIDPNTVILDNIFPLNLDLAVLPYNKQGYPVAPNEISNFYFQKAGDKDSGQEYIDVYRKLGFNVTKTVDNKKSWVYSESATTRFDNFTTNNTDYTSNSSKLIINTKEIGINLDPIQAIECDIYSFNYANNYPVSNIGGISFCSYYGSKTLSQLTNLQIQDLSNCTFLDLINSTSLIGGRPYPYPNNSSAIFSASALTFSQYITKVYSGFVNVQNRKTVDDGKGGGYPSLTKLYYDYLKNSYGDTGVQSNEYSLRKVFNYINKFQNYYTKFFDQLIPATTIMEGEGIKIRNTIFTPQKFVYKHGIDYSSQFKTNQTEIISDTISFSPFNTNDENNNNSTNVNLANKITIRNWETNGKYIYSVNGNIGNPTDNLIALTTTINPKDNWESELFVFDIPEYTMYDSADKIYSGVTGNTLYYYDNDITNSGKTINFIFTGNTNSLSGNNTNFNYNVYKYNTNLTGFSSTNIFNNSINQDYFITGNTTFTNIIPKVNINGDSEYLIKGYFNKFINTPTANTLSFNSLLDNYGIFDKYIYPVSKNYYERYFDYTLYSGYTGTTFSTSNNILSNNDTVINYDQLYDWYFISLSNSLKPTLLNLDSISNNGTVFTPFYTYESLFPNVNNEIILSYFPIGDIQLTVNGSSLLKNVEYIVKTGLPSSLQNRVYTILVDFSGSTDTVTVGYLADANNVAYSMANDSTMINYVIPSGTTQVLPYKTLFNTTNNKYELYLDQEVSGDTNSVQIIWNGASLLPNNDYNLSIINKKRVVFNNLILSTNDVLLAIYITGNTSNTNFVNVINNNPYTFQWQINTGNIVDNKVNGYYQLEFSQKNDINFTGTTIVSPINVNNYINTVSSYSNIVDFTISPYNSLISGNIYNVRVKNSKLFTSISNQVYTTINYSDKKFIKIPY